MKVLVTGDREWGPEHVDIVFRELSQFPVGTIIIHGACRGVDTIADLVGKALGFTVRDYPARFDVLGPIAGPMRNQHMIDAEHLDHEPIDLVLAFHHNISESRGTKSMIKIAEDAGLTTRLVEN